MNVSFRTRTGLRVLLAIGTLLAISGPVVAAVGTSVEYRVQQRWSLAGPGGSNFLLVSEKDHRLYISRETQLTVVDTDQGKTTGEIRGLTDVRGIALDPDGNFGYIGDGISGMLKVFSVPMLKLTASIKIGGTPNAVVFEPVTHRVFVFDSHNKTAVVVDPSSLQVIATLPLAGRPAAAMADGTGSVFVNLVSTSQLARIDALSLSAPKPTPLSPCVGPNGIALDPAHSRIFSTCENKLMAIADSRTGEIVTTVPVGEGAKNAAFDPSNELAFSANGEGSVTVIKEESATKLSTVQTVKTEPGARTMVFDPEHGQLYLFSARFGQRAEPTSEELEFRPTPVPGSSVILVLKP